MSKDRSKDAEAYDREYDAFLKQLEEFHQQRGTPFKRLPRINGKGVDLYLLYVVVTARGGWQKVGVSPLVFSRHGLRPLALAPHAPQAHSPR
ncbi:uncharacterized protein, partial [Penaeus vannamei]|uniref:uncharacterized protein n=1 Tax=Penaeus vannamei TaxID=6689 RepID=UPI00387F4510